MPILVGGTGLYFNAITKGLSKIPIIPERKRSQIRSLYKKVGREKFYKRLLSIDPKCKNKILPFDTQRILRAYEVKKFTKKSLFIFTKNTKSSFTNDVFKKLFINTPRELLHKNIENRVEKMIKEGAIRETKKFFNIKINKELSSNKIIGLKEIKDYLDGKISLIDAKELIAQKTRQYAKRQFTWARGHMKSWDMIYSANINDLFKKAINKIF